MGLGMVWGGKGAFGTWFSGDPDCIYGINFLPSRRLDLSGPLPRIHQAGFAGGPGGP